MFAYCNNSPIVHKDTAGTALETVWDVISLCFSIAEVCVNPADARAWIGLAGDILDVVIPFAGGIGETVKAISTTRKISETVDDVRDASKVTEQAIKSARSRAVREAWKKEVELVSTTGKGTRNWTFDQTQELLTRGKVKGFEGHHMKSVNKYPHLAGDPDNIQFLTRAEHLKAHNGHWRFATDGRFFL